MRKLTRAGVVNASLYAPAAIALLIGAALLPSNAAALPALAGFAWVVAWYATMWLFEPAVRRWLE